MKKKYYNGGDLLKDFGAGAYGLGEGLVDNLSFGLTDPLTDKGFTALNKLGNSSGKDQQRQEIIRSSGNIAGNIGGALLTGGATTKPAITNSLQSGSDIVQSTNVDDRIKAGVNAGTQLASLALSGTEFKQFGKNYLPENIQQLSNMAKMNPTTEMFTNSFRNGGKLDYNYFESIGVSKRQANKAYKDFTAKYQEGGLLPYNPEHLDKVSENLIQYDGPDHPQGGIKTPSGEFNLKETVLKPGKISDTPYAFSDINTLDLSTANQLGIDNKHVGKTMAEISKSIEKKYSVKPTDDDARIKSKTLMSEDLYARLMMANESALQKAKARQQWDERPDYASMSFDEFNEHCHGGKIKYQGGSWISKSRYKIDTDNGEKFYDFEDSSDIGSFFEKDGKYYNVGQPRYNNDIVNISNSNSKYIPTDNGITLLDTDTNNAYYYNVPDPDRPGYSKKTIVDNRTAKTRGNDDVYITYPDGRVGIAPRKSINYNLYSLDDMSKPIDSIPYNNYESRTGYTKLNGSRYNRANFTKINQNATTANPAESVDSKPVLDTFIEQPSDDARFIDVPVEINPHQYDEFEKSYSQKSEDYDSALQDYQNRMADLYGYNGNFNYDIVPEEVSNGSTGATNQQAFGKIIPTNNWLNSIKEMPPYTRDYAFNQVLNPNGIIETPKFNVPSIPINPIKKLNFNLPQGMSPSTPNINMQKYNPLSNDTISEESTFPNNRTIYSPLEQAKQKYDKFRTSISNSPETLVPSTYREPLNLYSPLDGPVANPQIQVTPISKRDFSLTPKINTVGSQFNLGKQNVELPVQSVENTIQSKIELPKISDEKIGLGIKAAAQLAELGSILGKKQDVAVQRNPYTNRVSQIMQDRTIDMTPIQDQIASSARAAYENLVSNNSQVVSSALGQGVANQQMSQLSQAKLQAQQINNGYAADFASTLNNLGQQDVAAKNYQENLQAQTDANVRNVRRDAIGNIGNDFSNYIIARDVVKAKTAEEKAFMEQKVKLELMKISNPSQRKEMLDAINKTIIGMGGQAISI